MRLNLYKLNSNRFISSKSTLGNNVYLVKSLSWIFEGGNHWWNFVGQADGIFWILSGSIWIFWDGTLRIKLELLELSWQFWNSVKFLELNLICTGSERVGRTRLWSTLGLYLIANWIGLLNAHVKGKAQKALRVFSIL